jgi:methionyl-tRNA formyltransferase
VSLLEGKKHIELPLLTQVAEILKLPVEAFQNFDEDSAVNIIANTFNDNAIAVHYKSTVNLIDKIIELHDEKIALYERMLKEKEEMMVRLERLIEKR